MAYITRAITARRKENLANVRVEIPRDMDVAPEEGVTLIDESHRTRYARTQTEIDREYSRFCAGVLIHDAGGWRYSSFKITDTNDLTGWDVFVPVR